MHFSFGAKYCCATIFFVQICSADRTFKELRSYELPCLPHAVRPVQTGQTDQFHRAKLFLVETSLNASVDFIDESTFWSWPSGEQNISANIFYALRMHCMALDALNLLLLGKKERERERVPFTQVARKYVAKNILIMQLLYFSTNYAKKF